MTFTPYPVPRRVSADRIKRIEDELVGGGGGGGGGFVTMSSRPLCDVRGIVAPPVDGQMRELVFDQQTVTIVQGEDYWGSPGSAQPFPMYVDENGALHYPNDFDDAICEITTHLTLTCDQADAGKIFTIQVTGNAANQQFLAPVRSDGQCFAPLQWVDWLFQNDRTQWPVITTRLETGTLAGPISLALLQHTVIRR